MFEMILILAIALVVILLSVLIVMDYNARKRQNELMDAIGNINISLVSRRREISNTEILDD